MLLFRSTKSRLIGLAGGNERSFLLRLAALVNRFQTNADRDATNYNGVGLIDRIAVELGTAPSLARLTYVAFVKGTFTLLGARHFSSF